MSILQKTREFVLLQMERNDAAHDCDHILRVVSLTKTLCAAYPQANAFRAELLAWLHDLSDDKLVSNIGASSICEFLQSIAVAEEDIRFILDALPYISYRKHPKLSPDIPLEIRIVQDADRIDAIGAALGVLLLSLVLWIQTRISMKKLDTIKIRIKFAQEINIQASPTTIDANNK